MNIFMKISRFTIYRLSSLPGFQTDLLITGVEYFIDKSSTVVVEIMQNIVLSSDPVNKGLLVN